MSVPPQLAWELVVVDNGSSDHTSQVVEMFQRSLPARRVEEPKAGLSNARNAGVMAARGRYILWTDDDVLVDKGWLSAYAAAFRRWPDLAVFGGKATPLLESPTPDWFEDGKSHLADLLAVRDFGTEPIALDPEKGVMPYGLNYAIRAAEQKSHPYDPRLGVAPGRLTGDEETNLITAILNEGGGGMWIPDAKVTHIIPPSRQTEQYIARYYRGRGQSQAMYRDPSRLKALARLLKRTCKLLLSGMLYRLAHRRGAGSLWVKHLREYALQSGWLEGTFRPQQ